MSSVAVHMALILCVHNQSWVCFIVVHASSLSMSIINTSSVVVHMALTKSVYNH